MATSALIGALHVKLGLDSAQFEAGTKRAKNIAKRDATEIQRIMGGVKASFAGLATGAAAGALIAAGKRALDYAANLGEVAAAAGVSTTELQEYSYAATQAGISEAEMEKLLAKLTKTMGEAAAGGKAQAGTFRELGIALEDASGRAYTAGEVIPRIADALQKIESPAERARILTDLFGKSGQKLETLLAGGARGVNELRDAAHRLGLVLSEDQIQKADETADKLAEINKQLEVKLAGVVADNADAIMTLADAFTTVADAAASGISWIDRFIRDGQQAVNRAKGWTIFGTEAAGDAAAAARWKYSLNQQREAIANFGTTQPLSLRPKPMADGDPPQPSAGGGGGGRRRGGGAGRDRTRENLERFNREMEGLRDEQLQLTIDQTRSLDERAQLEAQRIMNEREAYINEIKLRYGKKELTELQKDELIAAVKQIAADKQALMWNETNADKLKEQQRLADASFDIRENVLRMELDTARTQGERRNIELRLLDIEYEREKAALDHLKALFELGKATMAEVDAAEGRVAAMDAARGGREDAIRRNTMGPMEQYLDSLPKSAAELNEAYQRVAVDGLQSLNDGLVDAIMNAKSLGDVFKNVANQIIADLIRIAVQKAITNAIGGAFGGGLFGSIGSLFGGGGGGAASMMGSISRVKGLATGGSFMVGGNPGVDRNMLAINGIPQVRVSAGERVSVSKAGAAPEIKLTITEAPGFASTVQYAATGAAVSVNRNVMGQAARRGRQQLAR